MNRAAKRIREAQNGEPGTALQQGKEEAQGRQEQGQAGDDVDHALRRAAQSESPSWEELTWAGLRRIAVDHGSGMAPFAVASPAKLMLLARRHVRTVKQAAVLVHEQLGIG